MESIEVRKVKRVSGEIEVPPDKSISHRAVMSGAIASGTTRIENFLMADDCIRTIEAFRAMGVEIITGENRTVTVAGRGVEGLREPEVPLYLGNSGTSMRLLLGILAGCEFKATLTGDESLSRRPMKRVTGPLRMMGAEIEGKDDANFAPLVIKGKRPLKPLKYTMPVPSAQVKSAILFAGLQGDGTTEIREPVKSRDHTERMLKLFGAQIDFGGDAIFIKGPAMLTGRDISVPGDISSAAFFICAAAALPGSSLTIKNLGLNPTRTGVIDALRKMGAKLEITNLRESGNEPRGDLRICGAQALKGTTIEGEIIPRMIDELPAVMVAASQARGRTVIRGAKELRVKETDRISSMSANLRQMGVKIEPTEDGVVIDGPASLAGARVSSYSDHRTAMSMAIAGMLADGRTVIEDTQCISTSFPGFEELLKSIAAG